MIIVYFLEGSERLDCHDVVGFCFGAKRGAHDLFARPGLEGERVGKLDGACRVATLVPFSWEHHKGSTVFLIDSSYAFHQWILYRNRVGFAVRVGHSANHFGENKIVVLCYSLHVKLYFSVANGSFSGEDLANGHFVLGDLGDELLCDLLGGGVVPFACVGCHPEKGGDGKEKACNDAVKGEALDDSVGEDVVPALAEGRVWGRELAALRSHRVNACLPMTRR